MGRFWDGLLCSCLAVCWEPEPLSPAALILGRDQPLSLAAERGLSTPGPSKAGKAVTKSSFPCHVKLASCYRGHLSMERRELSSLDNRNCHHHSLAQAEYKAYAVFNPPSLSSSVLSPLCLGLLPGPLTLGEGYLSHAL